MPKIVYGLVDTSANKTQVFYVGITVKSATSRLKNHINEAKALNGKSGTRKENKINKLLKTKSIDVIVLEQDNTWSTNQLKEKEKFWIAYFRSQGIQLTNATDGGDGTHGYKFTKKQVANLKNALVRAYEERGINIRAKMSASSRLRWDNSNERTIQSERMKNSVAAKKHRKRLHKALKGRSLTSDHREAIAKGTQEFFDNHPEVGKAHSLRMKKRYKDPKNRKKISISTKSAFNDPSRRSILIENRRKAGAITNAMKVKCLTCGMISTPGPLGIHLKATGHRSK